MIGELVSTWIAILTRPSVSTFEQQKEKASSEKTLTTILIAAVVTAILTALFVAASAALVSLFASIGGVRAPVVGASPITALVNSLVQTIVGFYLFCYVLQYIAPRFGGTGNLNEQSFLLASLWAPVNILVALLMFIPCLGQLAALALGVYALVLVTFAVQAGQRLKVGSAVASWLIAGIITAIVLGILSAITGGWL